MSDERLGLPSGSSAARYVLCPGSFLLEQQMPEGESSVAADSGNRIHNHLAGEVAQLDDDEAALAALCSEQERALMVSTFGLSARPKALREHRLWSFSDRMDKVWSAKPDVVYLVGNHALVIDYKTGRSDVEGAAGNLQLRSLAALMLESFGVTSATVAVIQPMSGQPTVSHYDTGDLHRAAIEMRELMLRVQVEGQPRHPTASGCRYCKAKTICPEALALALSPPVDGAPTDITPAAMAAGLTGARLGTFLDQAIIAEQIIGACRVEARRRLDEGELVAGWTYSAGGSRENIIRPEVVCSRFLTGGGTQEQFLAIVEITKKSLKAALKASKNVTGKELDFELKTLLDGCTETKTTAQQLIKTK